MRNHGTYLAAAILVRETPPVGGWLSRKRVRIGIRPLVLAAVTAAAVLALLFTNHDNPTYTCRSAISDVFSPEPEESAAFRRDVAFDVGYACNRDARLHVATAVLVLI